MKTEHEVRSASDAQLITFWNEHNPQKQFTAIQSRSKFEQWCIELIEELAEEEATGGTLATTPNDAPSLAAGVAALQAMTSHLHSSLKTVLVDADKVKPTAKPAARPAKAAPTVTRSNASGVASSWADAEVAAARLTRDGVSVTVGSVTTTHKSTREAFRAYKLPDSKHIRFRLKLKTSRAEMFEHDGVKYYFTIG